MARLFPFALTNTDSDDKVEFYELPPENFNFMRS